MNPRLLGGMVSALVAAALFAPAAQADFGFLPGPAGFSAGAEESSGNPARAAGSHPDHVSAEVNFELAPESPSEPGIQFTDGDLRDLHLDLPPGLIENPSVVTQCSQVDFHTPRVSPFGPTFSGESCPGTSQIGTVTVHSSFAGGETRTFGVFSLAPPPGFPSQFGFSPYGAPVTVTPHIREANAEYGLTLDMLNFPQELDVYGLGLDIWGVPWSVAHDGERGNCLNGAEPGFPEAKCSVGPQQEKPRQAYLTLPASCSGPLTFRVSATSWQGGSSAAVSEGASLRECEAIGFTPDPLARLNTNRASSPSGFDFTLQGDVQGLTQPGQRSGSQVKKAVLTLPEGVTVNPSVAAGLGVCTPAGYAAETLASADGAGCPSTSKIGELLVESPLFEGQVKGGMFLAEPSDPEKPGAENPFGSMLALYLVAKSPERGVLVKLAGKVVPDQRTGRLVATFDGLPQLPYSRFNVHFREGQRTPLATPAACGAYQTRIELSPWLEPGKASIYNSQLSIGAGIGGGPCPAGKPPFRPGATAGTLNRAAARYSPYYLHLTRSDGEQEITSYSTVLPPGLLGKIKGIPYCPEAAIAEAARRSGFAETRAPSCPAASQIGKTSAGYGVGSVLAYAPGGLYLAGPYGGRPFSIVAIDSATVGPFDLGVIIVRSAIRVDPKTAQVSIDSSSSDPIPHILAGIPLHLRDIRIYIDKPSFMVNPTSCDHLTAASALNGSGVDFGSRADDSLASANSPFQVSSCLDIGFGPRLAFTLRGGTRRGRYPSLKAVVRPQPGEANIGKAEVTLPPSLFLAQEHIGTICTRPQFQNKRCPRESLYGSARAVTPLLGQPLEGPVYLRASANKLPDLVADIEGAGVRIEVAGRIDSRDGGMRATFDGLPDAPVSKFTMNLFGGKRGLLVNSDDLCKASPLVLARMGGQSNAPAVLEPKLQAGCKRGKGGKR